MSPVSAAAPLATRCPNCKGALVRRGSGWTPGASVWFHCFFCKHSWKGRVGDPRANCDGELAGEMFVGTRRKEKHSLRSVVVHAIPEDALKEHLQRKAALRALLSGKLQHEIDALAATLAEAQAEEDRLWSIQKQDESNLQNAKAWSVAFNNTKKIARQLEELRTHRQHLTTAEQFLTDLPSAISTATTNADGTFTLAIPRDGRYGIVARASRALNGADQTYLWFLWISLDGQPTKRLVLNHDNVVGAGSPDSALP